MENWIEFIFSDRPFRERALQIYAHQRQHNAVYSGFCEHLVGDDEVAEVKYASSIPLLPIAAFKEAAICTEGYPSQAALTFKSSGTGSMSQSTHFVRDETLYQRAVTEGFRHFYDLENAVFLCYTPGYSDNPDSSLTWMLRELISHDAIKKSRFLPLEKPLSQGEIDDIAASGRQLFLFGAAFGLMDLIEISDVSLPSNSIVIETGGMKTHRREMSRRHMHQQLANAFGLHENRIHSEYGMCELLSQAYTTGGRWFQTPPWMQVTIRDPENPLQLQMPGEEGLIGIVDLANVHSCSFLLTEDRGVMDDDGRFQVLGRWNPENMRGCNFLIDED